MIDQHARDQPVRRYARDATWQQAAPTWPKRPGVLGSYRPYLKHRPLPEAPTEGAACW
ncbi:hypothetical protein ACGFY7_19775 [Streptomyces prunicolor]|uniref:hypothetical protein n=1 Tax=Streptomyces prunicolor TaxID=67348 RepID=UPI003710850A